MDVLFDAFPLRDRIGERAREAGLELAGEELDALERHARKVAEANRLLHLTSIRDPHDFVDRHIGESLEGARFIPRDTEGVLLDFGSGNGYPGVPIAIVRPGLECVLAEASAKKARFLEEVLRVTGLDRRGRVLSRHVARAQDIADLPPLRALTVRAAGGWEKILPRLAPALAPEGILLLWAGEDAERVLGRKAWQRYELVERRLVPRRDRSWIWCFRKR